MQKQLERNETKAIGFCENCSHVEENRRRSDCPSCSHALFWDRVALKEIPSKIKDFKKVVLARIQKDEKDEE